MSGPSGAGADCEISLHAQGIDASSTSAQWELGVGHRTCMSGHVVHARPPIRIIASAILVGSIVARAVVGRRGHIPVDIPLQLSEIVSDLHVLRRVGSERLIDLS